jgi:1,2-diacylglycerol 3-alpha-glucosyltransferase
VRIGIVTTWFERGAAYVSRQYKDLLEERHEVFIYARGGESYGRGDANWDTPEVTWGKKVYFQINDSPISRRDFEKWIKGQELDVVIFNEQHWWPAVFWAKELGVVAGAYVDYYTERTLPLFGVYDFLVCNTKRHYSAFEWHPDVHYVPWGTRLDLYVPGEKREEDRDKVVFFNSSGHDPDRKGVYPLLKAFGELNSERAKLLLHTQVDLERHYRDLSGLVERLQGEGRLEIVSETVTAPGLYSLGDVYCYATKLEGIGLSLPEALSSGLPIITPDEPPMNEFVEHDVNGRLVKVRRLYGRWDGYYWPQCEVDEADLVAQLEYYVDRADEMADLKAKAREYAVKHLDWADRGDQLCAAVENAKARPIEEGIVEAMKAYELRRTWYFGLIKLPYRMWKNFSR